MILLCAAGLAACSGPPASAPTPAAAQASDETALAAEPQEDVAESAEHADNEDDADDTPPPPLPPAPSPPPEQTMSSEATSPSAEAPSTPVQIYWNTWIEPPCGLTTLVPFKPCPVGSARRDARNTLVVSLSMDDLASRISVLADRISAPAGSGIQPIIDALGGAPFSLAIIPVLTDGSVELVEGRPRIEYLEVDPAKLVSPETSEDVTGDTDLIQLTKRARAASAGMLKLPLYFTEQAPPCTHVTLAIWDGQLRQPIDSLTIPVSVGSESVDYCAEGVTDSRVRTGVSSFISFADPGSDEQPTTSVSLHSFEFELKGSPRRGFVVVAGHENGKPYVHGWETQQPISELLSRTGALPARVMAARKMLSDPKLDRQERKRAYGKVGAYLRDALFTARSDRRLGIAAAEEALDTFKRIASSSTQLLTVHARFTTPGRNGEDLFYAPLRLLAAAGADAVTGDLQIIQPLPKRHGTAETCIDRWTIIAAPNLVTAEQDPDAKQALDAVLGKQPTWVAETIKDSERLTSYFAGEDRSPVAPVTSSEPDTGRADGVLLLAHHSNDAGFYFEEGHGVMIERAKRTFRPGSVAVLAACATVGAGSADGFVKWLNASHVDGIFASPFLVDASYATIMSHEIFKALDHAYDKGLTPTLGEILQTASVQTGRSDAGAEKSLPEGNDAVERVMPEAVASGENLLKLQGLEYVVAGNVDVRLCRLQQQAQEQPIEATDTKVDDENKEAP